MLCQAFEDLKMLDDIERLQEETSVREERIDEIHQQLDGSKIYTIINVSKNHTVS